MKELITITKQNIGAEEVNSIDARELWLFLKVKSTFPNWISDRIKQYDFIQSVDFITKINSFYSPPRKEYTISLDMAMVLSVTERKSKGSEAYVYFCKIKGYGIVVKHIERKAYYFGEEIIKNMFSQYKIIPEYPVFKNKYRIDWYIPELKLAIEFDEPHHFRNAEEDKKRQAEIEVELGCRFARYEM